MKRLMVFIWDETCYFELLPICLDGVYELMVGDVGEFLSALWPEIFDYLYGSGIFDEKRALLAVVNTAISE